jgi:hypothetical protein
MASTAPATFDAGKFPLGTTLKYTAAVKNAKDVVLPNVPLVWTTDAGTLTPDVNNPEVAVLVNAPLGIVNVTAATQDGNVSLVIAVELVEVVDNTPASITVTVTVA